MTILYGLQSPQVDSFTKAAETIRSNNPPNTAASFLIDLGNGTLRNMKAEIEAGLVGSLQKAITGEVLTDFLELARTVLEEKGDDAKNVAAVLAASLFEDTMRRLSTASGIPHIEKLQDVLTELKNRRILQGTETGTALSYLKFCNKSLHAQWDDVGRESVASVLGFVEQLLIKHFA